MKSREQLFQKLETIVYVAVVLYLLDIIVLGGGDLTRIFGISTKMIWFAIAVVLSAVMMLFDIKKYINNKMLLAVGLFMLVVFVNAIRGFVGGEEISRTILLSDVKGFLNFLIVIPMVYVLNQKERIMKLVKIFTITLSVLAIAAIILSFYLTFPAEIQRIIYDFLNNNAICGIAGMTSNVVRVFFHTASRLFFCGFLFALGLSIIEKEKKYWMVAMVIQVLATFFSFTRSIYLALFITAIVLFAMVCLIYKEELVTLCKRVGVMVIAVLISLIAISAVQGENVFSVAINRCLFAISAETPGGDDTETTFPNETETETEIEFPGNLEAEQENLSVREIRTQTALRNIAKNPILGNGLGTINDPNGRLIEYFYLDLLSKTGIVGFVTFLLPMLLASLCIWKNWKGYVKEQKMISLLVWAMVIYLLIISYFNPCMNTTTGLSIYSLLIAIVVPWRTKKQIGE